MVKSWLFDVFNYPYTSNPNEFDPQKAQELFDWHADSWVLAEKVGFEGIFFSEHHYTAYCISPSPNLFIAAAAQRTERVKLGVMINLLPMHTPRRLAEEFAMLSYMTHGRLEIGIGRGLDQRVFRREGIAMNEVRARFEEGVEIILKMLENNYFHHEGRFWSFGGEDTALWPRPLQRPVPKPWVSGLSPETVAYAGKHGFRLSSAFTTSEQIRNVFIDYRKAAAAAGHPSGPENTMVLRQVFCAETDEEARRIAEPALNNLFKLYREAVIFEDMNHVPEGFEFYSEFFRPFAGEGPMEWDALNDLGIFVVGSPETVRDKLINQAKVIGTENILMWSSFGTLTAEQTTNSYRLLGQEVIPALNELHIEAPSIDIAA